jgi:hypothetical protein
MTANPCLTINPNPTHPMILTVFVFTLIIIVGLLILGEACK